MSDLFTDLATMRSSTVQCVLQSADEITDAKGNPVPVLKPGSKPTIFEIIQISSNELSEADAILDEAKAPPIITKVAKPQTLGLTEVLEGYDFDHPDYLAARNKLLPRRAAYICLFGCPVLMATTPGTTTDEKAAQLLERVGATVIEWLRQKIENMVFFNGVGAEDVARFLAVNSGEPNGSSDTKEKTPRRRRNASSPNSTAPPSPTKSEKPPGSGE